MILEDPTEFTDTNLLQISQEKIQQQIISI